MATDPHGQSAVFEIRVEREEGFSLAAGLVTPWQGWHVRYRPLGSRGRWAKFLTDDDLAAFSTADLQACCAAHKAAS